MQGWNSQRAPGSLSSLDKYPVSTCVYVDVFHRLSSMFPRLPQYSRPIGYSGFGLCGTSAFHLLTEVISLLLLTAPAGFANGKHINLAAGTIV